VNETGNGHRIAVFGRGGGPSNGTFTAVACSNSLEAFAGKGQAVQHPDAPNI